MWLNLTRLSPGPKLDILPGPDGKFRVEEGWRLLIAAETATPATAHLSGVPLRILKMTLAERRIQQEWQLDIFVWAGRSTILVVAGNERTTITLDVAPHGEKLGAQQFRAMLEELAKTSKDALWGLSPGSLPAERDTNSPGIVHPAVIDAELDDVLHSIQQLRHDLLLQHERRRDVLPLARSRRPDNRTLQWMLRNGRSQIALKAIADGSGLPDPSLVVDQATIFVTKDHPANRYIALLIIRLRRSFEATKIAFAAVAQGCAEGNLADDETRARAAQLSEVLERAAREIQLLERSGPMVNITPAPPSESALQAIAGHPLYARAHTLIRRLLDPGLRISEDQCSETTLHGALRPTYELFELLVWFRLKSALSALVGPDWAIKQQDLAPGAVLSHNGASTSRWTATAPDRKMSVELAYQPVFAAHNGEKESAGARSLSGQRRPDFTVAVWKGPELLSWVILDAKYRASRSAIHEALADIHVYRDALRWNGRACASAFIVVPALAEDALRYGQADYIKRHAFGALILGSASDHKNQASPAWLAPAIAHVSAMLDYNELESA